MAARGSGALHHPRIAAEKIPETRARQSVSGCSFSRVFHGRLRATIVPIPVRTRSRGRNRPLGQIQLSVGRAGRVDSSKRLACQNKREGEQLLAMR